MPKNFFQDMVKIKNENREKLKQQRVETPVEEKPEPKISMETETKYASVFESAVQNRDGRKKIRRTPWIVAIISVAFFVFALSYLFSKVVVTVNPKVQEFSLNENLSANKDGNTDALPFNLVAISGEETKVVQATEEKEVSLKAQGVVVIYNAFSSAPQMLSIDTRLEGSNGKMYKTLTKTTVPGMTKSDEPGSVEVKIYGAEAGEEYNSDPLDFKIFGFKGTPKYSKFYARSNGSITGGFKGKMPVISDTEKAKVLSELKIALQEKLLKKATDQIPSGFILFKDAVFLNTENNNIDFTALKDNILPIKLQGTLYGLLFNEEKLTKKIAKDNIEKYDDSEVFIPNIKDLVFVLSNKDNTSFASVKNINFNLSGSAKIVWKLDNNKLANDLLGKSKKEFNQVLSQYPNIDSAGLEVSPFWKMSLPDKVEDIKIMVNYPQ